MVNLDEVIRERFQVAVEVMNPFRNIRYSESDFDPEWINNRLRRWRWRWASRYARSENDAMIKINLVAETPAAATQASRPQFSLGAKQGDIILLIVLAMACIVVGTQWYLLTSKRAELRQVEQDRRRERDDRECGAHGRRTFLVIVSCCVGAHDPAVACAPRRDEPATPGCVPGPPIYPTAAAHGRVCSLAGHASARRSGLCRRKRGSPPGRRVPLRSEISASGPDAGGNCRFVIFPII